MENNWIDRKILVLGLSKSGISAAKYLNGKGAKVWLSEYSTPKDEELLKAAEELKSLGVKLNAADIRKYL